jgi:hypothetical protein
MEGAHVTNTPLVSRVRDILLKMRYIKALVVGTAYRPVLGRCCDGNGS